MVLLFPITFIIYDSFMPTIAMFHELFYCYVRTWDWFYMLFFFFFFFALIIQECVHTIYIYIYLNIHSSVMSHEFLFDRTTWAK